MPIVCFTGSVRVQYAEGGGIGRGLVWGQLVFPCAGGYAGYDGAYGGRDCAADGVPFCAGDFVSDPERRDRVGGAPVDVEVFSDFVVADGVADNVDSPGVSTV